MCRRIDQQIFKSALVYFLNEISNNENNKDFIEKYMSCFQISSKTIGGINFCTKRKKK